MKKYIIMISSIITISLTTYFSLLPLAGFSQADISGLYSTTITPAGYTFIIWSLIYLSWIILGIYLVIGKNKKVSKKELFYLASAQILSALWLIPWHYEIIYVSFFVIFLILGLLFYIIKYPSKDLYFNKITELYFGWILIATILNFHVLLVFIGKYTYGLYLGVISILLGVLINYYLLKKYSTYLSSFVLIWALIGIIIGQGNDYMLISGIIGIFITALSIILKENKE